MKLEIFLRKPEGFTFNIFESEFRNSGDAHCDNRFEIGTVSTIAYTGAKYVIHSDERYKGEDCLTLSYEGGAYSYGVHDCCDDSIFELFRHVKYFSTEMVEKYIIGVRLSTSNKDIIKAMPENHKGEEYGEYVFDTPEEAYNAYNDAYLLAFEGKGGESALRHRWGYYQSNPFEHTEGDYGNVVYDELFSSISIDEFASCYRDIEREVKPNSPFACLVFGDKKTILFENRELLDYSGAESASFEVYQRGMEFSYDFKRAFCIYYKNELPC